MTFDNSNLPAIFCKTESNKKANSDAGSIQRIFMALFDPGKGLLLPRDINATRTTLQSSYYCNYSDAQTSRLK